MNAMVFYAKMGYIVSTKKDTTMTENSVVRARIDLVTKAEAAAVLATIGLSVSDAIRLMLKRVVAEKALPFEPLIPNAETIEAIKAARRGELVTVASLDSLFTDLNADD
jgi:DNA-damage-inducible protein J